MREIRACVNPAQFGRQHRQNCRPSHDCLANLNILNLRFGQDDTASWKYLLPIYKDRTVSTIRGDETDVLTSLAVTLKPWPNDQTLFVKHLKITIS